MPLPIPTRKRRFIVRSLKIAKFTNMKEIAERAGVDRKVVLRINKKEGIRDKKAILLAKTGIPRKTVYAIVGELVENPEKSFNKIAKNHGIAPETVARLNYLLSTQSKEVVSKRKRMPWKPRHHLFSTEAKWTVIEKSAPYVKTVLQSLRNKQRIYLPVDDIISETKIRAFSALDMLENPKAYKQFIAKIAKNIAIDYIKKELRTVNVTAEELEKILEKRRVEAV